MASPAPVWFIAGCSTGFGRALATLVIACEWRIVVTARDSVSLDDPVAQARR